jgi:hypothetical protein
MPDSRLCELHACLADDPQAESKIDILIVTEKGLIEAAYVLEYVPTINGGGGAWSEDLGINVNCFGGATLATTPREPKRMIMIAGAIDHLGVVVSQLS